jgi:hypothetical protein
MNPVARLSISSGSSRADSSVDIFHGFSAPNSGESSTHRGLHRIRMFVERRTPSAPGSSSARIRGFACFQWNASSSSVQKQDYRRLGSKG